MEWLDSFEPHDILHINILDKFNGDLSVTFATFKSRSRSSYLAW